MIPHMKVVYDLRFKFTCDFKKSFYLNADFGKAQEIIVKFMS